MRVLWFSNAFFNESPPKATGTWLYSMAKAMVEEGIELYNITQRDSITDIVYGEIDSVKQYVLPKYKLHNGIPSLNHINKIQNIVDGINPDIIHIWGLEGYWGLLTARGFIRGNVLLEIQGIRETCARVFYGGLSWVDVLSTIQMKEWIKPQISLPMQKRCFKKWSSFEHEIVSAHKHITTQSDWVRSWVSQFSSPDATIYETNLIVRSQFLSSDPWSKPKHEKSSPVIFTLSSEAHAFKGIHDGIKAVAMLKRKYPGIQFRVAGNFEINRPFYKKNGYTKYLLKLIKSKGLENNVLFLGSLDASALNKEMQQADVMIQTSYVESYSLALAEAMAVGVPCVVSYAGAMPELARDGEEALFYTPSDYFKLAFLIDKIICNRQLSESLSVKARELSVQRNSPKGIIENQITIYNKVCGRI